MRVLLVEKYRSPATSQIGDDMCLVVCAEDADEAMVLLQQDTYDMVLLNMTSTPQDGLDLTRRMRAAGDGTPILALTRPQAPERINALRLGADDVLVEPVNLPEMQARMLSVLRSSRAGIAAPLRVGNLSLHLSIRDARFNDTSVRVTPTEFSILELMVRRKGSVLTKTAFLGHLYAGSARPDAKIIDVFMCKLRKKLERAGAVDLIVTVWNSGYMMCEPETCQQSVENACQFVA